MLYWNIIVCVPLFPYLILHLTPTSWSTNTSTSQFYMPYTKTTSQKPFHNFLKKLTFQICAYWNLISRVLLLLCLILHLTPTFWSTNTYTSHNFTCLIRYMVNTPLTTKPHINSLKTQTSSFLTSVPIKSPHKRGSYTDKLDKVDR